jgi:hypothetical protein
MSWPELFNPEYTGQPIEIISRKKNSLISVSVYQKFNDQKRAP